MAQTVVQTKMQRFLQLTARISVGLAFSLAVMGCYKGASENFDKPINLGQWRGYEVVFMKDESMQPGRGVYFFKKMETSSTIISEGFKENIVGYIDKDKSQKMIFVTTDSWAAPARGFYAVENGETLIPMTTNSQQAGKAVVSVGQEILKFEAKTKDLSVLTKDELTSLAMDIQKFAMEKYPDAKEDTNKPKPF